MSYEAGQRLEQSGDYDSALSIYWQELESGRLSKNVIRGLFRSTLKVGDIHGLSLELLDLCESTGINSASAQLMQGRLLLEIGEIERAKEFAYELDSKFFSISENIELELLKANILALEFRFYEAIELLRKSDQVSINHLRRIAELELAAHRPESAVNALKLYVKALNKKNALQGSSRRFLTASGFLFNLANQIWLEQEFPEANELPSLLDSMKILQRASIENILKSEEIFKIISPDSTRFIADDYSDESLANRETSSRESEFREGNFRENANDRSELLLMFIDKSPKQEEFSIVPKKKWEIQYRLFPTPHIFTVEESGIAIWTNFKVCSGCSFVTPWSKFLKSSKKRGEKSFMSHRFPGGRLTQLLAQNLVLESGHSPEVLLRNSYRRGRKLPGRYEV
jgi:hypothetical protein